MIETVNVTKIIALTGDTAWQAIAQIGGLECWFPLITECTVIGCDVGATRILTLASGEKITDIIKSIDHKAMRFQYNRIESPFPVSRYHGTVDVRELGPDSCEISWTVEFTPSNAQHSELIRFLKQVLTGGIDGLERDLLSSATGRKI